MKVTTSGKEGVGNTTISFVRNAEQLKAEMCHCPLDFADMTKLIKKEIEKINLLIEQVKREFKNLLEDDIQCYGTPPKVDKLGLVKETVYVTKDLIPKVWSFIEKVVAQSEERGYLKGLLDGRKMYYKPDINNLNAHTNKSSKKK